MSKTIEKKEKTTNEIARTFFWTSLGCAILFSSVCMAITEPNFISYIIPIILLSLTLNDFPLIACLLIIFSMLFARHKIKKTTIVKKSQIKSISLNLLLRFSILAFICGFADYLNSISGPPYGLLVYEIFIFTTCATVFLITISEKD